jgi:hypothetical protein
MAAPQVLQVLADPGHPDLPAKLRFAASAITAQKHRDLPLWLQGGLLTHLFNILTSLQRMGLDPAEAADICAATAATLCNIIRVARICESELLSGSAAQTAIEAQVAAPDILSALVQHGMLGPAAQEPLPPGRDVPHIDNMPTCLPAALGAAAQAVRHSKQLWTPLRLCAFLLVEALTCTRCPSQGGASRSGAAAARRVDAVVGQLAREGVLRHLLLTAVEDPGGAFSVT